MGRFAGRTALVTGAGSGIGARLADVLAQEGATVVVVDRDGDAARHTALEVAGSIALEADVSSEREVTGLAEHLHGRGWHPDLVVNNAATCSDTPVEDLPLSEWHRDLDVSLTGAFLVSRTFLPDLRRARGVVVNVASVNAVRYFGNEAYSAAKAGLVSLTRSLAVRWAPHGIRVNVVLPGTVRTPAWDERLRRDPAALDRAAAMYPMGRVGVPDDVAQAVLFLASEQAAWITGVGLPVDGGLLANGSAAFARTTEEGL